MPAPIHRSVGRVLGCLLATAALVVPSSAQALHAGAGGLSGVESGLEFDAMAAPAKKKSSKGKKKSSTDKSSDGGDVEAAGADEGKGKKSKGKKGKGKKGKGKKGKDKKSDAPTVPEPPADAPPAKSKSTAPPSGAQPLTLKLPLKVARGKLPKSSKGRLLGRLEAAVAGTSIEGGPYSLRMSVGVSKKRNYSFTVTVSDGDGDQVLEVSDACKGCSLSDAGNTVAELVNKAATDVANLPPPPGTLTVTTDPAGATVMVDGKELGPSPQTLELPPGDHEVVVTQDGFEKSSRTVTLESKGKETLDLPLEKVVVAAPKERKRKRKDKDKDEGAPAEPTPADTGPKAGKAWTIGGGVVLGLGIAGVLTGVALILVDERAIPFQCKDADVDFRGVCRVRYDTLLGGSLGVAAGALGIGGGIALMVKGRKVTMKARAGKSAASLGVAVRF